MLGVGCSVFLYEYMITTLLHTGRARITDRGDEEADKVDAKCEIRLNNRRIANVDLTHTHMRNTHNIGP